MSAGLPFELDATTGQVLVGGIHDATVHGVSTELTGIVNLSVTGADAEPRQLVVSGTGAVFVFSVGIILPTILEAAFWRPTKELLSQELGTGPCASYELLRDSYCSRGWAILFTCSYGSPFVVFGENEIRSIQLVPEQT